MNAEEIFLKAVDLRPGEERDAWLKTAFAEFPEARADVESLLKSHDRAGSFLDAPLVISDLTPGAVEEFLPPDAQLGPFKLLQVIGRGGMGIVYRAEQLRPVQRQVALKVIRSVGASRSILARFEAERQALAIMDHPNIARVIDAGETPAGLPWFAMELVNGIPITRYCDQARLEPRRRLELMIQVCQAVQHAHQKGIIHRDLKPSNVLVTEYDGRPVPKVIDFGVAKALDQKLTDHSMLTDIGLVVGTLEYMSPEQAGLDSQDIDTRSDVYSLGVLLYELLTGSTPIDRKQLTAAAMLEVLRIIREVDPLRPSERLSTAEEAPSLAANRSLEPARLSGLMRGDLDWIAMKALDKDRARRYQSANDMASDLVRYLGNEPVLAGPPSANYRLRKFLKRHRTMALACSIALLALIAGTVASTWGWMEARSQFQAASQAENQEREARELAEKRLKHVETGIDVLTNVFQDLNPNASGEEGDKLAGDLRAMLAKRLNQAAEQLQTGSLGEPVSVARLQYKLCLAMIELGETQGAFNLLGRCEPQFSELLGPDDVETLNCQDRQALCLMKLGQLEESRALFLVLLNRKRKILGETHSDTLATWNNLALVLNNLGRFEDALREHSANLEVMKREFGPDSPNTMSAVNSLAISLIKAGRPAEAAPLLVENLERRQRVLGKDHPDTLGGLQAMAMCWRSLGQTEKVVPLLEEAARISFAIFGADSLRTISSNSNLAIALQDIGELEKSSDLLESVLQQRKTRLGNDHPSTLATMSDLGVCYRRLKKYEEAIPLLESSLEGRRRTIGPNHPDTLRSLNNLGTCWRAGGNPEKALPLFQEAVEGRKRVLGDDHPDVFESQNNLAGNLMDLKQFGQAETIYHQVVAGREKKLGENHPSTLLAIFNLGQMYRAWGKADQAVTQLELTLHRGQAREAGLPPNFKDLPEILCEVYLEAGRVEDAEKQCRAVWAESIEKTGRNSTDSIRMQAALGRMLWKREKWDEAEMMTRECLDIRLNQEADSWTTFYTECLLGAILFKKGSHAEAEKLLEDGLSGLEQRTSRIPKAQLEKRIPEAKRWLVELYRATGREDEARQIETSIGN